MAQNFQIRLQGTSDTRAWVQAQGVLRALDSQAQQFVDSLRAGVGIDLGGKIVNSLAALPNVFTSTLRRGFEFNRTLADTEVAISNVLQKFQGLDQAGGDAAAAGALQQIVELEPKVAGTLNDLAQGFLASAASAQAAGLTVEQNIDLVGKFANGLANASIPAEQLVQELRAVFSGNITPDAAFAKILGLTNEAVRSAKEAGTLYEELDKRIGKLGESGDTAAVALSTLDSAVDKAAGVLAKPLFEAVISAAKELTQVLSDPAITASLRDLGREIGVLASSGLDLVKWTARQGPLLVELSKAAAAAGGALAAFKIGSLILSLARAAALWGTNTAAVAANTAALRANSVAAQANGAAQLAGAGTAVAGSAAGAAAATTTAGAAAGVAASRFGAAASAAGALAARVGAATAAVANLYLAWRLIFTEIPGAFTAAHESLESVRKKTEQIRQETLDIEIKVRGAQTPEDQAAVKQQVEAMLFARRQALERAQREGRATLPLPGGGSVDIGDNNAAQLAATVANLESLLSNFSRVAGTDFVAVQQATGVETARLNEQMIAFAAAAGDAEANAARLRAEYVRLAESASELTGINLRGVEPDNITGAIASQITEDTLRGDDGKKAAALNAVADGAKTLLDAEEARVQKQQDAAAKARQLETDLLGLKVRALEAAGAKAAATNAKVLLEARQLAEQLFSTGQFGDFEAALQQAQQVTRAEADAKRAADEEELQRARQRFDIEDQIAAARASGLDDKAAALEDEQRAVQLAQEFSDTLKIGYDAALQRARERVANERQANELARDTSDRQITAALNARAAEIERGKRRSTLDEFYEKQKTPLRDGFRFPGLDAFAAAQNDPRRRQPVSSVALPPGVQGPVDTRNAFERQQAASKVSAGGAQTGALAEQARIADEAAKQVAREMQQLTSALAQRGQATAQAVQGMVAGLKSAVAALRAEAAQLREQIKNLRT